MYTQSRSQLDQIAVNLFGRLIENGFLNRAFDPDAFHSWKMKLKDRFVTTGTTITPLMERTLFGLAAAQRPVKTVALGSFEGYALVWLAAAAKENALARVVGYDIDPVVCRRAEQNFESIELGEQVQIRNQDAFSVTDSGLNEIDLLYIDVEANGSKAAYSSLLDLWYPRLRPGALILAHDIAVKKFAADLKPYLQAVRNDLRFTKTLSLNIDFCGLEVTQL